MARKRTHEVAVLVPHGAVVFDVAIPCQVLGIATLGADFARYRVAVCQAGPLPAQTSSGFSIDGLAGFDQALEAGTLVVPGTGDNSTSAEVSDLLQEAYRRGARIVSICTGAFALAAAGLLDGRRATTHWDHAQQLAEAYPQIDVDAAALYVQDGNVFTSAGLAAGIDLCLHLVRLDHGAEVANLAARRMVVPPHRSGDQAQFVDRPVNVAHGRRLDATREWMLDRIKEPITLEAMAGHAYMSRRSFSRHFIAETGTTPLQWLVEQRVRHAQRLLESSHLDVEGVASESGFGTATSLRQHFRRVTGTTPLAYRQAFFTATA